MTIVLLTLFPQYFKSILETSIIKRALVDQKLTVDVVDIRKFATDKHQTTDDRPFGGGPGMVMKVEPIHLALQSLAPVATQKIVLTSAKGELFTQAKAQGYSQLERLVIICGHYEGVDERVADNLIDEEIRIGEFVLTGGEPAAAVMLDAVARLLPGVLGNELSNQNESHSEVGVGGFPQYTRPVEYQGWSVPEVLLSGDHAQIEAWRQTHKKKLS